MMKSAVKNIKNNYLLDSIKCLGRGILYGLGFITIINLGKNTGLEFLLFIIVDLIFLGSAVFSLHHWFKNFYFFLYPFKSNIYKVYGDISKILDEIELTAEYDDKQIIISERFVISKCDYRNLFLFDDVLGIYVQVHRTNLITDRYSIVVADKFERIAMFNYLPKQKDIVNEVLLILISKCKNAKIGYSDETLDYIKSNQVEVN